MCFDTFLLLPSLQIFSSFFKSASLIVYKYVVKCLCVIYLWFNSIIVKELCLMSAQLVYCMTGMSPSLTEVPYTPEAV